jgi:tetratricopeptide (TPR) repeat protein
MYQRRLNGRFKSVGSRWRRVGRLVVVLGLAAATSMAAESPKDNAGWWVTTYGVLDKKSDPLVGRVEEVFARVSAAADKKGNRLPRLVIVNTNGDPFAVALPDGTIVLTRGALEFCYSQEKEKNRRQRVTRGDLRLAFVVGHELAHLARDDFWHASAFSATQSFVLEAQSTAEIRSLLRPESRDVRLAELQADSSGAIYMAMAGFSPAALFEQDPDFFVHWSRQAGLEKTYEDPSHPSPEQRATILRTQLAAVAADLEFFHFGVRLAELGRYEDSILLLERFNDRFPGREVLTDLAYAHYQMALRLLSRCDGAQVMRFRLPVAIDDETLAGRSRLRGHQDGDACLAAEPVQKGLAEARRYLELAVEHDRTYMPARHLLLAIEIVSHRAAAAIAIADDSLQMAPNDAASLNAKGVALYLFEAEPSNLVDNALAVLESAKADKRVSADAAFNQGTVLTERGRTAGARAAWGRFLEIEPRGAHADFVRERLNSRAPAATKPARRSPKPASPIALGPVGAKSGDALQRMESREFTIGALRGVFYVGSGMQALQLGNIIEVVEQQLGSGTLPAGLKPVDTPPVVVLTPRGRLLRYTSHAVDYEGTQPVNLLFFAPATKPATR